MDKIETARLVLRTFRHEDSRDFYEYAKSAHVGPGAGWRPHKDEAETKAIIEMFLQEGNVWAVTTKTLDKVIGSIGLHNDLMRPGINGKMLGYAFSDAYWGHGIATEAAKAVIRHGFQSMGLEIISVVHYPDNLKSARVIEKCGFVKEGVLRMSRRIYNDTIRDAVCYSLLREEYDRLDY